MRRHVRDCRVEIIPGLAHTVLRDASPAVRDIVMDWLSAQEAFSVKAAGR
jgi:hypothetical protein